MRTSKSHAISPSKVRKVCEITTECRALTNVLYAYQEIVNIAFEHKTPKVGTFIQDHTTIPTWRAEQESQE